MTTKRFDVRPLDHRVFGSLSCPDPLRDFRSSLAKTKRIIPEVKARIEKCRSPDPRDLPRHHTDAITPLFPQPSR
jgi:hypothetical protein